MKEIIRFENIDVVVQRRMFQRTMNLLIKPNGQVKVTAGKTVFKKHILHFLNSQRDWLLKNVKLIEDEKNKFPNIKYRDGETVLFIARPIQLRFCYGEGQRVKCRITSDCIEVQLNPHHTQGEITKAVKSFYKKSGIEILSKVMNEQSERMQLYPKKVSFRAQKTRWGSCSSEGNISLNWKLILCPPEVIEYVVIHELCHLKHQNHSQTFWSLVEKYSPNYKIHEVWLKKNHYQIEKYNF